MKLRRFFACMMALLLVCSLPLAAFAAEYDLAQGSVTVNASESGQTVTHGTNDAVPDSAPVITQSNSSTPTSNTITINADAGTTANVTLSGVNINTSGAAVEIKGNGDVVIELDGSNTVQSGYNRAGVEKNNGGNLTITDETGTDGSLKATGGDYGSGIGGGDWGSGSNITISGSAEVTAQGGWGGSGIGGGHRGSGSNITITGSAEVNATGGDDATGIGGSGIGGGDGGGSGNDITISGSAEVTAQGGNAASGIGGGFNGTGSDITISEDAQVKAQGGNRFNRDNGKYFSAGAAIGNGGTDQNGSYPTPGSEVPPSTNALNEGWIATYAPGTQNMNTAIPDSLTYRDASGTVTTEDDSQKIQTEDAVSASCTEDGHKAGFSVDGALVAVTVPATGHSFTNYISDKNATYDADGTKTAKCDHCDATDTIPDPGSKLVREAPLYRVIGQDGKTLSCKKTQKDGVLTIKVDADFATLTGTLSGLKTLKAQGVDTIVFVTNGATSTFAIADLLAQGNSTDTYKLTHDGTAVTFTLGAADVASILK